MSPDRLAIGQLLGRLLREFRTELFSPAGEHGYADLRETHLQIFGNVGIDGVRLTDLAARSLLSLATTSELVSDLQRLGYLERRPDPVDRRAKLIFPTTRGRQALDDAGNRVAEIEQHWRDVLGDHRFDDMCRYMQDLLDFLRGPADEPRARSARPPTPPIADGAAPRADGAASAAGEQRDPDREIQGVAHTSPAYQQLSALPGETGGEPKLPGFERTAPWCSARKRV